MDIQVTDAGALRKQLTITYAESEISKKVEGLLRTYGQAKVNGFRNGKAPLSVLKKRFGEAARAETVDRLLQDGVNEAISENKLKPIGPFADDERNTDDGIKLVTSFDVHPEFDLPEPDSIEITNDEIVIDDAAIDEELQSMAKRSGETADIAEGDALQADDTITITGKITSGDETVRDVHDLNHLLGAYPLFGKDHGEVLELVADKKVGDVLSFDTTLPEHFHPEEWAGKDAHVEVTIQRAQRLQPAEINDEFAKKMGSEDGVEALKERVKEYLGSRKENERHQAQIEELTTKLLDTVSFELPSTLLENLVKDGLAAETGDDKPSEEDVRKTQEDQLRRHILVNAVADKYEVQATQEDLQQQIMMAAYQSGRKPEELAKQLQESGRLPQVAADIREAKALETMLAKIVGDEEAESAAEEAEAVEASGAYPKS